MPDWTIELVKVAAALSAVLLPAIGALYLYRSAERKADQQLPSGLVGIGMGIADRSSLLLIGEGLSTAGAHLEKIAEHMRAFRLARPHPKDGELTKVLQRVAVPLETIAELMVKQYEEAQEKERERLQDENAELKRRVADYEKGGGR